MNGKVKLRKIGKQKFFLPADLIIYAVILLLIAAFTLYAVYNDEGAGTGFEVYYKQEMLFSASLGEDARYLFYIDGGQGRYKRVFADENAEGYGDYNLIEVAGGRVRVSSSDCRTGQCVASGWRNSGVIECRAHGMYIKIVGTLGGDA